MLTCWKKLLFFQIVKQYHPHRKFSRHSLYLACNPKDPENVLYLFSLREWERNEIGWFLPTLLRSGCPVFIWKKKNLRSRCFFPKLLSSSTNKLKLSFQTTSPMQIITKPGFDMDRIAHCEKDFPNDPRGLGLCFLFLCSHQIHSSTLQAAFVYGFSTSRKEMCVTSGLFPAPD